MLPSIELGWVRRFDKQIITPRVVFSNSLQSGGRYHPPERCEVEIDGQFHDLAWGLVEVGLMPGNDIAGVLAHEWRHHWQTFNGWPNRYYSFSFNQPGIVYDYYQSLVRYFVENPEETDAIRFQRRVAGIYPEWEKALAGKFEWCRC